jgi:hypothetical protein
MIGESLTLENLRAIYEAMSKIKEIDRSEYFNQYLKEVEDRIKEATSINITLQKLKSND